MILELGQTLAVFMGQEKGRPFVPRPYRAIYRGVKDRNGKYYESFDTAHLRKNMHVLADVDHHSDRPRALLLGYDQVLAKEGERAIDVLTGEVVGEEEGKT